MDLLLVLVAMSFGLVALLGYSGCWVAGTSYQTSNLVDTKNKSSRRARQLQSIVGGNPPGEAARLICSVPIPLLSSLWIMNG
ncbi:hypothetical protein N7519_002301 [Penicillium mononematosum]|uniref:uncharacterized protein n=1 Tax=Penicillium mononematosum TaxID=268346 RepID=UPI0025487AE1|nr:uncharacterized protein N7519_002301 [Penicillium mononematosum]KAJ6187393.1 hypothetical protein N7519_002301 [Penicillium mononematosum]